MKPTNSCVQLSRVAPGAGRDSPKPAVRVLLQIIAQLLGMPVPVLPCHVWYKIDVAEIREPLGLPAM